jgi:hypothetical protein
MGGAASVLLLLPWKEAVPYKHDRAAKVDRLSASRDRHGSHSPSPEMAHSDSLCCLLTSVSLLSSEGGHEHESTSTSKSHDIPSSSLFVVHCYTLQAFLCLLRLDWSRLSQLQHRSL